MFFCAFFPTFAGNSVGNFRFFADFSAKKCFLPQKSPYNAVFFRKRLWKILLKFPAVLWVFSPKPIFSTQSRTKFPTIAGNFVEKSKGRRYGAGDRRVAPALCGRKSGLFRKPSRRLDPSFVSRCVSKSYVNITKVMRNRISTTEIRFRGNARRKARLPKFVFRGNCGAARRAGAQSAKKASLYGLPFLIFSKRSYSSRSARISSRSD